jgi:hypothetical protein
MNAKLAAVSGTDRVACEQYLNTFRRGERFEPEFVLVQAILEDAIHLYQKYRSAKNRMGREHFREVEDWIMGSGGDWIFSFENVCQLLRLDASYLRQKLRRHDENPPMVRKPRRRATRRAA